MPTPSRRVSSTALLFSLCAGVRGDEPIDSAFFQRVRASSTPGATGHCLSNQPNITISKLPPLKRFLRQTMHFTQKTPLRLMVKDWSSTRLKTAMVFILLEEVLDYQNVSLRTTPGKATAGSFRMLSEIDGATSQADVDMELWQSSSQKEFETFEENYERAGPSFIRGRSGLYLRPPPNDANVTNELIRYGATSRNLEEVVAPRLQTVSEAIRAGYCAADDGEHCVEYPNRECLGLEGTPQECKAVLKADDVLDAGLVEAMIRNASLPLGIVYTGSSSRIFDHIMPSTDSTLMFYFYEPDVRVGQDSPVQYIRVAFDDPMSCIYTKTTQYPANLACDFPEGGVHKGLSKRIRRYYADVAYLIKKFKISDDELALLQHRLISDPTLTDYDVACEWLRLHPQEWEHFLQYPPGSFPDIWYGGPIALFSISFALVMIWVCLPCLKKPPEVGHVWYRVASQLRPKSFVTAVPMLFTGSRWAIRKVRAWMAKCSDKAGTFCSRKAIRAAGRALSTKLRSVKGRLTLRSISKHRTREKHHTHTAIRRTSSIESGIIDDESRPKDKATAKRLHLIKKHREGASIQQTDFSDQSYDSEVNCAAAFIQGFHASGGKLRAGILSRAMVRMQVSQGIQFAQRYTWGLEKARHFVVGICRGRYTDLARRFVRISTLPHEESTAREGIDYIIADEVIELEPNQRFAEVEIILLDNDVSVGTDLKAAWLPVRQFQLKLEVVDHEVESQQLNNGAALGSATTCKVFIVDKDDWPSQSAVETGLFQIYRTYCIKICLHNLQNECYWLIGVILRQGISQVARPILRTLLLLEVALRPGSESLEWSFVVAAALAFSEVVHHFTSYWYASSWVTGYNMSINWVFSKWAVLPLHLVLEPDIVARYREMVALIMDDFFSHNDYTQFANLVNCLIEWFFLVISPFILQGLGVDMRVGSESSSANVPLGLVWGSEQIGLSAALATIYFLLGVAAITTGLLAPGKMVSAVTKWIQMEGRFNERVQNTFTDTIAHRTFKKSSIEHVVLADEMTETRNQKFHYLAMKDAGGQRFTWFVKILGLLLIAFAPLLLVQNFLSVGVVLVLIGQMESAETLVTNIFNVCEGLHIGKMLIVQLASVLNTARPELMECVNASYNQFVLLRRMYRDQHPVLTIQLHNVRFSGKTLRDENGTSVAVTAHGRIPLGELIGVPNNHSDSTKTMRNKIMIDLLAGHHTVSDGAIVFPPYVKVGVVPSEPSFMLSKTLLENLTYGCGSSVPEDVIWKLCKALGLPSHFFSAKGGSTSMSKVNFLLAPYQRQLVSLLRSILCMPDVLLVHDLGHIPPQQAELIGQIFKNFVAGVSLSRLVSQGASGDELKIDLFRFRSGSPNAQYTNNKDASEATQLQNKMRCSLDQMIDTQTPFLTPSKSRVRKASPSTRGGAGGCEMTPGELPSGDGVVTNVRSHSASAPSEVEVGFSPPGSPRSTSSFAYQKSDSRQSRGAATQDDQDHFDARDLDRQRIAQLVDKVDRRSIVWVSSLDTLNTARVVTLIRFEPDGRVVRTHNKSAAEAEEATQQRGKRAHVLIDELVQFINARPGLMDALMDPNGPAGVEYGMPGSGNGTSNERQDASDGNQPEGKKVSTPSLLRSCSQVIGKVSTIENSVKAEARRTSSSSTLVPATESPAPLPISPAMTRAASLRI